MRRKGIPGNGQEGKNVLQFPSRSGHGDVEVAKENAVLQILTEKIRGSDERAKAVSVMNGSQENLDALLRTPHFRGRLTACIRAHLTAQLPLAVGLFVDALSKDQGWAFKLLFDLTGLHKITADILELPEEEEMGVIISSAFERDYVERVLRNLRAHASEQPTQGPGED